MNSDESELLQIVIYVLPTRGYGDNLLPQFSSIKNDLKKAGTSGLPMGLRLFSFLLVLVITMLIGVISILLVSGTFTAGLSQSAKLVQNDLAHLSNDINDQFGFLSQNAIEFSKSLSAGIENRLRDQGKNISSIKDHPELLEDILSGEFDRALAALLMSKSSGVFIILDGTINPTLSKAEYSRAGLYIKNMEPNIISSSSPNIHVLRGHPNIARKNSLPLHAQWNMEFDVTDAPYYNLPLQAAKYQDNELSLSQLYYWTPPLIMPGTSEEVMICSIPLIDSHGRVFGVCGFDISAMLFKLSYAPRNSIYGRAFSILFSPKDETIDIHKSMVAGGYSIRSSSRDYSALRIIKNKDSFFTYKADGGYSFLGFHSPVKLYPKGAAFSGQQWMVAIMIPKNDVVKSISRLNILLSSLIILLLAIGIIVSFFLSKSYVRPISQGFSTIKSSNLPDNPDTKIPEINDLIDFLNAHDEKLIQQTNGTKISLPILEEFINNTKTLSPAERTVFDLYVQGHTAKEIAGILSLSINTIKTHNKRIYMKLNVGSREELLLYINLLKDIGRKF